MAQYFCDLELAAALADLEQQSRVAGWLLEERKEVKPGRPALHFKRGGERRIIFGIAAPKGAMVNVMDKTDGGELVGSPRTTNA